METADYKIALFILSSVIPPWKHDKIKSICDVFIQLQISGDLYPADIKVLYKLLKKMDRGDLISKVRAYQGAQPTSGNTKLGYGPEEHRQVYVPRTIESKEPEYQGAQPTSGNTKLGYGPEEHRQVYVPRTIESKEPEYQGAQPTSGNTKLRYGSEEHRQVYVPRTIESKEPEYQGAQPTSGNTKLGYGPEEHRQVYVPRTIESKEPEYQGAQPTSGNTKLRYGPEEHRQVYLPRTIESKEPEYQGAQPTSGNTKLGYGPEEHRQVYVPRTIESKEPEYQGIRGTRSKNSRTDHNMDDYMHKRFKMQDIENYRAVPSLKYQQNPVFSGVKHEQPSPGTNPSVRGVGNQTPTEPSPFHRTGIISEVPVNHLIITEEQSPGDSGLTAGFMTFLDRSSQDKRSGDIPLSITESKLVGVSKVIARRDDCFLLASALMIDSNQTSQIMQANPTNVLRVHGFLKHWFIEQRNRSGTSPTADALLKAFEQLGFTDAIEEYARLSREPEAELEQGSENLAVRSEKLFGIQEQNFNVSSAIDKNGLIDKGSDSIVDWNGVI
ncbi:uncharacterized protein LOC127719147 [Mytilus californianus]|uniref:uncharacterized protein LOC127719147 n=1 Tax=Mytilus californianus TaxID=6549 RepID=UPI002245FB0D|nr:uncharacterized protein LOC127719147 [Mytilus californianus]